MGLNTTAEENIRRFRHRHRQHRRRCCKMRKATTINRKLGQNTTAQNNIHRFCRHRRRRRRCCCRGTPTATLGIVAKITRPNACCRETYEPTPPPKLDELHLNMCRFRVYRTDDAACWTDRLPVMSIVGVQKEGVLLASTGMCGWKENADTKIESSV